MTASSSSATVNILAMQIASLKAVFSAYRTADASSIEVCDVLRAIDLDELLKVAQSASAPAATPCRLAAEIERELNGEGACRKLTKDDWRVIVAALNAVPSATASPKLAKVLAEARSSEAYRQESASLDAAIKAACEAYEKLSPVDKALHDSDQRRSYVEGETGRDPGDVLADEVRRLRALPSATACTACGLTVEECKAARDVSRFVDRIAELEALLQWLDARGGLGLDVHGHIRAVLHPDMEPL